MNLQNGELFERIGRTNYLSGLWVGNRQMTEV